MTNYKQYLRDNTEYLEEVSTFLENGGQIANLFRNAANDNDKFLFKFISDKGHDITI